jgi:hypothetical protein
MDRPQAGKETKLDNIDTNDLGGGNGWLRNQDQPQYESAGEFSAWIVGVKNPPSPGSAGVSCAGWYVTKDDGTELPVRYARTSDTSDSDEQRAGVAAALRCLESLPKKATIKIQTRAKWIANAINKSLDDWQDRHWLSLGGEKRNGWEIWEKIIQVRDSQELIVNASWLSADDDNFTRLRDWARVMSRKKSEQLGVHDGDHFEHRKGRSSMSNDGGP